jgi:hypothetical protein
MNTFDVLQAVFSGFHTFVSLIILSAGFGGIAVFLYELRVDRDRNHPKKYNH